MSHRALAVRRLLAFAVDWLVIAAWGALLFGVLMLVWNGHPPPPRNAWTAHARGLLAMTLPVTLYFTLCETSRARASLGKRVVGLAVSHESGARLAFAPALSRTALKFIPWEFGHLVAFQAVFSGDAGPAAWVWAAAIVALVVPLWWVAALFARGLTPYDRWTHARVAAATGPQALTRSSGSPPGPRATRGVPE